MLIYIHHKQGQAMFDGGGGDCTIYLSNHVEWGIGPLFWQPPVD